MLLIYLLKNVQLAVSYTALPIRDSQAIIIPPLETKLNIRVLFANPQAVLDNQTKPNQTIHTDTRIYIETTFSSFLLSEEHSIIIRVKVYPDGESRWYDSLDRLNWVDLAANQGAAACAVLESYGHCMSGNVGNAFCGKGVYGDSHSVSQVVREKTRENVRMGGNKG